MSNIEHVKEKGKVVKATCKICGKEFNGSSASGSAALHVFKSHGKIEDPKKVVEEPDDLGEGWQFLDPSDPYQLQAIKKGATMFKPDHSKPWNEWSVK